jgi:predicted nucleic acid-binding protein
VIVVDTGGVLALLDRNDRHHAAVRLLFEREGGRWILPWAILPEVDYLASRNLGPDVARAFAEDVRDGQFRLDANASRDLPRAVALLTRYRDLQIGLVDAVVMAQAERHRADAIVTLDARHFRAVRLNMQRPPRLLPIDESR